MALQLLPPGTIAAAADTPLPGAECHVVQECSSCFPIELPAYLSCTLLSVC